MYVDHINRPYDNRWENLRLVTQAQNQMNRSGGNIRTTAAGSYREIRSKGRHIDKCFETLAEAEEFRDISKAELFGSQCDSTAEKQYCSYHYTTPAWAIGHGSSVYGLDKYWRCLYINACF